jgi:hypothetical protein
MMMQMVPDLEERKTGEFYRKTGNNRLNSSEFPKKFKQRSTKNGFQGRPQRVNLGHHHFEKSGCAMSASN